MRRLNELHRNEELRKLAHISLGCGFAVAALYVDRWIIVAGLAVGLIIDIIFREQITAVKDMAKVGRKTYGDYAYILGIGASAIVFSNTFTFVAACLTLALSDGLAGLLGRLFGRHHYSWFGADKTILGSVVFFAMTYVIIWHLLIASQVDVVDAFIGAAITAFTTTIVEASLGFGLDNFGVPLSAGLLFTVLV